MKLLPTIWNMVQNVNCYHSIYTSKILELPPHLDFLDMALPSSQHGRPDAMVLLMQARVRRKGEGLGGRGGAVVQAFFFSGATWMQPWPRAFFPPLLPAGLRSLGTYPRGQTT